MQQCSPANQKWTTPPQESKAEDPSPSPPPVDIDDWLVANAAGSRFVQSRSSDLLFFFSNKKEGKLYPVNKGFTLCKTQTDVSHMVRRWDDLSLVIDCVTVSLQVCRAERLHLVRTKKPRERISGKLMEGTSGLLSSRDFFEIINMCC